MTAPLVAEAEVTLILNGTPSHQWRCTPADLEALIIGRMFVEGSIGSADDVHLIVEGARAESIIVRGRIATNIPRVQTVAARTLAVPSTAVFSDLFRALFQGVDARHEHGGIHAAAATDGQRVIKQVEDVGRHNTIDKIVGALLLDALHPADFGLLTSSRVSGEIADKAAHAGFAWLASRSIPTTLAVQIASAAHMPIIGRAPSKDAFLYS